ncbi:Protein of unknwon function (DUF3310) [Brevibacillus sp. CF112]|uniref:DUF3310 domain-containing protein n=1 Tax=Brevibacillus TaxID=55080 RepID=UPI000271BB73|nr:DUF3310 domain-containing protein [Brevibacillus sp. CF112]EJL44006.1 Protein of unknwon function (DUF3310) [Brevibacillus sp. CF112]
MLTREKYLQLRANGQSRTQIQRSYFGSNPNKFYALLSEWGLKEKDAEDRALDMMPTEKKSTELLREKLVPEIAQEPDSERDAAKIKQLQAEITNLRNEIEAHIKEREGERAENARLLKELEEKQKLIESLERKAVDPVNHPAHYTAGSIECIDAIFAATTGLAGGHAYSTGAAIEYLWRWSRKGGVEDLQKARWYIDRLIAAGTECPCKTEEV